ncbi:hypothetical protein EV182_000582 [Spiromyces aspiralis]|uniref:Uncharacterized protein n=1 Tax=Spiromyces aspiralis TaxID=68401 RepID=A0ACC1HU76_9FUNG|nr:hypothetical protein EV182_000582 [Spiromyces aspiralis]
MAMDVGALPTLGRTEELTRALRGTTLTPKDKLALAWAVWESQPDSTQLTTGKAYFLPRKVEFMLEWAVSMLVRSTKPGGGKPKKPAPNIDDDASFHQYPETFLLIHRILRDIQETSDGAKPPAESRTDPVTSLLTTYPLLPVFAKCFGLDAMRRDEPYARAVGDTWCTLLEHRGVPEMFSAQPEALTQIIEALLTNLAAVATHRGEGPPGQPNPISECVQAATRSALGVFTSACEVTNNYRKVFQLVVTKIIPHIVDCLGISESLDQATVAAIKEVLYMGLFRPDTLQDFGTILLMQDSAPQKGDGDGDGDGDDETKCNTRRKNRTIQSYQRQLFDTASSLFGAIGSNDAKDLATYRLLPALMEQFLRSASVFHPQSASRLPVSLASSSTTISPHVLRELVFEFFRRLISYLVGHPKFATLIGVMCAIFKVYYTDPYFGMTSAMSFVNDDVLKRQNELLRAWICDTLAPELRLASRSPGSYLHLALLANAIELILEANPDIILERLELIVPAFAMVGAQDRLISEGVFVSMLDTYAKTRQLKEYCTGLVKELSTLAFSGGVPPAHIPLLSSVYLRKHTEVVAKSMPFIQATGFISACTETLVEMIRRFAEDPDRPQKRHKQAKGARVLEVDIDPALHMVALLLVHVVVGASQSSLTYQQCETYQQCLRDTYSAVRGAIRSEEDPRNQSQETLLWLMMLVHYVLIDVSGRIDGSDEWAAKYLRLDSICNLVDPALQGSESSSGRKRQPVTSPRSQALAIFVVFQAIAHNQSSVNLGTSALAKCLANNNSPGSSARDTLDVAGVQWQDLLHLSLRVFRTWYEINAPSMVTGCQHGWQAWDGQPHTILGKNFGTAVWRLLSDWIEIIGLLDDMQEYCETMSLLTRLLLLSLCLMNDNDDDNSNGDSASGAVCSQGGRLTSMEISTRLLAAASFFEDRGVQKTLAGSLVGVVTDIARHLAPKTKALDAAISALGLLASCSESLTLQPSESVAKAAVADAASQSLRSFFGKKSVNQGVEACVSQIFWSSRIGLEHTGLAQVGESGAGGGDNTALRATLATLGRLLTALHRFPPELFDPRAQILIATTVLVIDKGVSQMGTELWQAEGAGWSQGHLTEVHGEVERIMVACRSWLYSAIHPSSAALTFIVKFPGVFEWLYRSAITSRSRTLLSSSGRLLSQLTLSRLALSSSRGELSRIDREQELVAELVVSARLESELDPFISSEHCKFNIASLHTRCLEASVHFFMARRRRGEHSSKPDQLFTNFAVTKAQAGLEKLYHMLSSEKSFVQAISSGMAFVVLCEYDLLLRVVVESDLAPAAHLGHEAVFATLMQRFSKTIHSDNCQLDAPARLQLVEFGPELCLFMAQRLQTSQSISGTRKSEDNFGNDAVLHRHLCDQARRFVALVAFVLGLLQKNPTLDTGKGGAIPASISSRYRRTGETLSAVVLDHALTPVVRQCDPAMFESVVDSTLQALCDDLDATNRNSLLRVLSVLISSLGTTSGATVAAKRRHIQHRLVEILGCAKVMLGASLEATQCVVDLLQKTVACSGIRLSALNVSTILDALTSISYSPLSDAASRATCCRLFKCMVLVLSRITGSHTQELYRALPNLIALLRLWLHTFVEPPSLTPTSQGRGPDAPASQVMTPWIIAYAPLTVDCAAEYSRYLEFLVHSRVDSTSKPAITDLAELLPATSGNYQARGTRTAETAKMLGRYVPYLLAEYCAIQGGAMILPTPAPAPPTLRTSNSLLDPSITVQLPFQGLSWCPVNVPAQDATESRSGSSGDDDNNNTALAASLYQPGLISNPSIKEALMPGWYSLLDIITEEGREMVLAAFNPPSATSGPVGSHNQSIHVPANLGGAREVLRAMYQDYNKYHKYSGQF